MVKDDTDILIKHAETMKHVLEGNNSMFLDLNTYSRRTCLIHKLFDPPTSNYNRLTTIQYV